MRRPNLVKWKQIKIKAGTKLYRKPPKMKPLEKSEGKVKTGESMEIIIQDGKNRFTVGGLRDGENYFRNKDGNSLTKPEEAEGWFYWGIRDESNEWKQVWEYYKEVPAEMQKELIHKVPEFEETETETE